MNLNTKNSQQNISEMDLAMNKNHVLPQTETYRTLCIVFCNDL